MQLQEKNLLLLLRMKDSIVKRLFIKSVTRLIA